MTHQDDNQTRWTALRETQRARRTTRAAKKALAHDLSAFDSQADRLELAAMLGRYDDAETEEIRSLVDLTRAA
jgi:hypothetical protein